MSASGNDNGNISGNGNKEKISLWDFFSFYLMKAFNWECKGRLTNMITYVKNWKQKNLRLRKCKQNASYSDCFEAPRWENQSVSMYQL